MALFARNFECPSCGGQIQRLNPTSKSLTCPYCGQTSHLFAETLQAAGDQHLLLDYGSFFQTRMTASFDHRTFEILGRVRFDYEDGFWDEWYATDTNDFSNLWIQEDDGSFLLFERMETPQERWIQYSDIKVGDEIKLPIRHQPQLFVTSKGIATVQGGEGEFPFPITPNEKIYFVDGIWEGKPMSIEIYPNEIAVYQGTPLSLDDLLKH